MDWKTKIGIAGSVLLISGALAFVIKTQNDTIQRLRAIETSIVQSKDIGDGIVRAQSTYVTKKDLEKILADQGYDIKEMRKDLRLLGADVKGISTIKVSTPGYSGHNIPSTEVTPNPNPPDTNTPVQDFGYLSGTQWLELTEPFEDGKVLPFGKAGFSAWQAKPWDLSVYPREYQATTVLTQDAQGRHYAYSRFQISVQGKTYTIPIEDAKIIEEFPSPKFHFNPRLYMGVDIGGVTSPLTPEVTPNLGLSFFSYGRTKIAPEWSFGTVGIGYATQTQVPVILVAPVNYNIGTKLPLIENLHIGPSISLDVQGNLGIYIGTRVGF